MPRFDEALHYVVSITKPDELGMTKLAKVMFYSDLEAYRRTGKPMTEAKYVKRRHGPMPADIYNAIERLGGAGKIATGHGDKFGYPQRQLWSREEPELCGLTARDVAILGECTRNICENHTAASISDQTHNIAWEVAETGEEIPFAAFLVASGRGCPTDAELAEIDAALAD